MISFLLSGKNYYLLLVTHRWLTFQNRSLNSKDVNSLCSWICPRLRVRNDSLALQKTYDFNLPNTEIYNVLPCFSGIFEIIFRGRYFLKILFIVKDIVKNQTKRFNFHHLRNTPEKFQKTLWTPHTHLSRKKDSSKTTKVTNRSWGVGLRK